MHVDGGGGGGGNGGGREEEEEGEKKRCGDGRNKYLKERLPSQLHRAEMWKRQSKQARSLGWLAVLWWRERERENASMKQNERIGGGWKNKKNGRRSNRMSPRCKTVSFTGKGQNENSDKSGKRSKKHKMSR